MKFDCENKRVLNLKNEELDVVEKVELPINDRTLNKNVDNEGGQQLFDNRINSLPVIMTLKQVADLFQVSLFTIYHWSSLGRFDKCKFKIGKIVRVHRDKLFREFFSESFLGKDSK